MGTDGFISAHPLQFSIGYLLSHAIGFVAFRYATNMAHHASDQNLHQVAPALSFEEVDVAFSPLVGLYFREIIEYNVEFLYKGSTRLK